MILAELRAALTMAEKGVAQIEPPRRELLDQLADYVRRTHRTPAGCRLNFICTHNSRRSQMAQAWAAAAAAHAGIDRVVTYSGGTEVTALNPRSVAALRRAGFDITTLAPGENPVYVVRYVDDAEPLRCFSKTYDDAANPRDAFAAVMTCTSADAACPAVPGATARIALPYEDPKAYDGTAEEAARYDACSAQIAAEMIYVMTRAAD
jgi:arsenate reductase